MIFFLLACTDDRFIDPTLSLPDTNTTSPSFAQELSLNDYEQKVSAWYFGHAT
jgi:hypothetical protein